VNADWPLAAREVSDCRVTLVFNIREGDAEGTDIAGRKVVMVADTRKVMTEGNWRLGVFVDAQATDEQFDKLVQVFSGQLGGPMGALAPLVGEMLGVKRVQGAVLEHAENVLAFHERVIGFEPKLLQPEPFVRDTGGRSRRGRGPGSTAVAG
jgi:hypothetical protein